MLYESRSHEEKVRQENGLFCDNLDHLLRVCLEISKNSETIPGFSNKTCGEQLVTSGKNRNTVTRMQVH